MEGPSDLKMFKMFKAFELSQSNCSSCAFMINERCIKQPGAKRIQYPDRVVCKYWHHDEDLRDILQEVMDANPNAQYWHLRFEGVPANNHNAVWYASVLNRFIGQRCEVLVNGKDWVEDRLDRFHYIASGMDILDIVSWTNVHGLSSNVRIYLPMLAPIEQGSIRSTLGKVRRAAAGVPDEPLLAPPDAPEEPAPAPVEEPVLDTMIRLAGKVAKDTILYKALWVYAEALEECNAQAARRITDAMGENLPSVTKRRMRQALDEMYPMAAADRVDALKKYLLPK